MNEITLAEFSFTATINAPIEKIDLKHEAICLVWMYVGIGACTFSHARAWCKNSIDDVGADNVHLLSNA